MDFPESAAVDSVVLSHREEPAPSGRGGRRVARSILMIWHGSVGSAGRAWALSAGARISATLNTDGSGHLIHSVSGLPFCTT